MIPFAIVRDQLQAVIKMFAIDGEIVGPGWVLITCKCRDAEGMLLATEFNTQLAITTPRDNGGPPCGVFVLTKLPLEHIGTDEQGKHD